MAITVNPVQNTQFTLTDPNTTFGPGTRITVDETDTAAVFGPAGTNWNVTIEAGALISNAAGLSDGMALGAITDVCTLNNAGSISGAYAGVYIPGKSAQVTNTGTITSTGYVGVKVGEKARVTNEAIGIVSAKQQAVILRDTCTLTNAGTLKTTGKECVLGEGPDSTLNNSGTIDGAVVFTRHAAITNTGTITGPITNPKH